MTRNLVITVPDRVRPHDVHEDLARLVRDLAREMDVGDRLVITLGAWADGPDVEDWFDVETDLDAAREIAAAHGLEVHPDPETDLPY